MGNRVPKSRAALSESSQNNCYSMQLGVLLFCYLCFLVSRAKRRRREKQPKNQTISTHNQGEVLHILPACTKRNLCTFFSFFMEKSLNSLTIYFNHVAANTTRLDGEVGLKIVIQQKSKALQEYPETDILLPLHSTAVPHTTRTLKVPSAAIPGTTMGPVSPVPEPGILQRACWGRREKHYPGEEGHQHGSRLGRQVVPGRYC